MALTAKRICCRSTTEAWCVVAGVLSLLRSCEAWQRSPSLFWTWTGAASFYRRRDDARTTAEIISRRRILLVSRASGSDDASAPTTASQTQVSPTSPGRVNLKVRQLMQMLLDRFDRDSGSHRSTTITIAAKPFPAEWTKARNYLYHTSHRITTQQVESVLSFLHETFPSDRMLQQQVLQSSPRILQQSVETKLQPTRDFLLQLYGDQLFRQAVQRNPDLLLTTGMGYNSRSTNGKSAVYPKKDNAADTMTCDDSVEAYLSQHVNLTDRSVAKLKRSLPLMFQLSTRQVQSVVQYLQELLRSGMRFDEEGILQTIGKIVVKHPTLLQLSVEKNLKPRVAYLKETCQLVDEDLAALAKRNCASVLTLSVNDNLTPKLEFLKERLGRHAQDDGVLRRCILAHPQLLGLSIANLQSKVEYFDTIDRLCAGAETSTTSNSLAARVLVRAPAVYSLCPQTISDKTEFLARVWGVASPYYRPADAVDSATTSLSVLLSEDPSILTLSLEGNIRPTVNFFNRTGYIRLDDAWRITATQEGDRENTRRFAILRPRYIAASLFNRLLPRWHFWLSQANEELEDSGGKASEVPPIHILVSATDTVYCQQLGYDQHVYREFKIESIPRLKFSSQFDTWLKTGLPIDSADLV